MLQKILNAINKSTNESKSTKESKGVPIILVRQKCTNTLKYNT